MMENNLICIFNTPFFSDRIRKYFMETLHKIKECKFFKVTQTLLLQDYNRLFYRNTLIFTLM